MLEIIVSILYFVNKVFLSLEKKAGWVIGILASSIATFYFFTIELYLFLSLEFACLLIMIFGLLGTKNSKSFTLIVYSVIVLVMLYLLYNIEESGLLEFITSISFMISFLLIARNKWNLGWVLLGISHVLMAFVATSKAQYFFATMQGLSVVVCAYAIYHRYKESSLLN